MKKTLYGIIAFCSALLLNADQEVANGLVWTYRIVNNEAVLSNSYQPVFAVPYNTGGTIVVPEKLGGCPVVEVGYQSFYFTEYENTTITFPASVKKLHVAAVVGTVIGKGNVGITHKAPIYYGVRQYNFLGAMPTVDKSMSSRVYGDLWAYILKSPFYVDSSCTCGMFYGATIHALKQYDWSDTFQDGVVVEKEGFVSQPEAVLNDCKVFDHSGTFVQLSSLTTNVIIRYTIDGTAVMNDSPIYTAPFAISETTTVRAKAFKEDWFDSEEMVQTFTRLWYTNDTPVVSAASETFSSISQEVTLSCETEGATIYYTISGDDPSETCGRVYDGPVKIYDTATVKAIAVKDDWKDSAVVSKTFTKVGTLGPAIDFIEIHPDNDKTHPWQVVTDITHDGVSAVKSGDIGDDEKTTLKVVVYGAGKLSFWWRTSCEPCVDGEYYDFATFYNGSTIVTNVAGVTDWQRVTLDVQGTGKHTFKWTYEKDGSGSMSPDGLWLDQVQWLGATTDYYSDHTLTTDTPVPYSWLMENGFGVATGFETAAKTKTGKRDAFGRELTVAADYVAGTDPADIDSQLKSYIEMREDGPHVTWEPYHKNERVYKIWGKESLDDTKWQYPTNSLHRFFKVTVEMP